MSRSRKHTPRQAIYQPESDTCLITLTKGYTAIVDAIDADLAAFKWHAKVERSGKAYARRRVPDGNGKRPQQHLHRVILERMLGRDLARHEETDHVDGKFTLDNRRANLRLATRSQNEANKPARRNNTSGYKGVSFHKQHKQWQARITVNRKKLHLGYYDAAEEAHAAYCAAAREHFGEFSNDGE